MGDEKKSFLLTLSIGQGRERRNHVLDWRWHQLRDLARRGVLSFWASGSAVGGLFTLLIELMGDEGVW
jgi:hypothetical protein